MRLDFKNNLDEQLIILVSRSSNCRREKSQICPLSPEKEDTVYVFKLGPVNILLTGLIFLKKPP